MSVATIPHSTDPAIARAAAPGGGARELMHRCLGFLNEGNSHAALELFEPQAAVDIVPVRLRGTAANEGRRFIEELVRAFPDLLIQVRSSMGSSEFAVAEIKLEGTQAADFLGILNQEKHVDLDQAWMIWVADGRIVKLRAYWCQNQLYRRLAVKRLDRISILG